MKNQLKFGIALGLIAASGVFAQGVGPLGHGGGPMGGHFGGPGMGGPMMGAFGPGGKVVTGAPYSADVNSQSVETLPDGNTITRATTGHIARDSQGRTYTQETITGGFLGANGPVTMTFINDPVAGYSYALNSSTKIATRVPKRVPPAGAGSHAERPNGAGRGPMGMEPDAASVQTSDLGTQMMSGVSATGKSMTRTIPAGAMGNAQPIISTGETWYSADLQTVVMAKHTDPRMGVMTYTLQNIVRTEPNAALFQVPSDYNVEDAKGGRPNFMRGGPRPPQ